MTKLEKILLIGIVDSIISRHSHRHYSIAHCSNPEVGKQKKLQEKSEAAMRTPLQRASKCTPT